MDSQAYYVVDAATGNKYGPADVATLNQWVTEGRVLASTMLEDAASGAQIRADRLPGLVLPGAGQLPPMSPPPGVPAMSAAPAYHSDEGWRGYPIGVHFDFLNDSWKFFKATWRQWASVVFILIVAYSIGNLPQWITDYQQTEAEQFESVLSGRGFGPFVFSILWSLIVTSPLYVGALLFGLDIVDGKAPELSRIFSPFKRLLPVVGASFLQQFMLGIGTAFCLIPGIYLLGRTYYWPILVADQKMGVMDAFGYTWDRQGPFAWSLFVLVLVTVILAAIGILGLLIGVFVTIPMAILTLACQYRAMYPEFAPKADAPLRA